MEQNNIKAKEYKPTKGLRNTFKNLLLEVTPDFGKIRKGLSSNPWIIVKAIYLEDSRINKNLANISRLVSIEARDLVAIRIENGPRVAVKKTHILFWEKFKTFPKNDKVGFDLRIIFLLF